MPNSPLTPGIVPGRLPAAEYDRNFTDLIAPLDRHEARVAADRCYFCYDAPCITACPTAIDIPLFIRQIATGTPEAAAKTIWSQNILGGICARVCPTETLCEQACVREAAEGHPVRIGALQRYATDLVMAKGEHPFSRAPATGRRIAVVGSGPAGLACAHRLALHGHQVVIFERRSRPGGLNEYGLASYKTAGDFAGREIDWLLQIGGIEIRCGVEIGTDLSLDALRAGFDAVYLGIGLQGVNDPGLGRPGLTGVRDAVDFIAELRQAADPASLPVGRDVLVLGGGMTAIDAAVQARRLGAARVTLLYRRSRAEMGASEYEQELALLNGVQILDQVLPVRLIGETRLEAVECAHTRPGAAGPELSDARFTLAADQLLIAVGQRLAGLPGGLSAENGRLGSLPPGVWAGGDCTAEGKDLTVSAVAAGRDAAEAISLALRGD
ncbi:NAD(P)-dependent oxidoreductase [Pseudogemmobacter faecipullorum]|uniref:NAD(P)-dependent oxidoreductase n=1 Tax=Pseudogemmobacter faecipullorum TaxID=2755041 RepID=A0ABS8CK38_9RHOB|nr:NAD(P)-dependent oxidoreductase [Pseudogemmobacter faecipullorum]MCB5409739.1 NAD(P)-dependent oxidoreductase [Pseudogemmobacter faecipullorum]